MAKAQGLSVNTIILVALGLLVLVIVGALTGRKLLEFGLTTNICPGTCVAPTGKLLDNKAVDSTSPPTFEKLGESFSDIRKKTDSAGPECQDFEKAAPGNYIAKLKSGKNPSQNLASCGSCCVTGG